MKKIVFALCLLCVAPAFANDGGMPFIEVNELTFTEADVGTKITFRGAEALSLFNALPSLNVMATDRGFTATGKKKSVYIGCKNIAYNEKTNNFDPIPGGPLCEISVGKAFVKDPNSDDTKWVNDREPQSVKETTSKDKKPTKKK